MKYLVPKYTGPVPCYWDHGVIEIKVYGADYGFYVDRLMYGESDHIFFDWPDDLIYPNTEKERIYEKKLMQYYIRRSFTVPFY